MKKLTLLLLLALTACSSQPDPHEDRSTMAYIICKDYVKESLKSPSSADMPFLCDNTVADVKTQTYKIASYVDAVNSFNAKLRTTYTAVLHYKGGDDADPANWQVVSLNFNN